MKANKALKRLAKIEALLSDVAVRYSPGEPHAQKVLQDANAAVARAREALSLQASSSGTAKNPPAKHSKPPSKAGAKKTSSKKTAAAKAT